MIENRELGLISASKHHATANFLVVLQLDCVWRLKRALYTRKCICFMDDLISSLDGIVVCSKMGVDEAECAIIDGEPNTDGTFVALGHAYNVM
jgi:hypothetical protein